MSLLLIGDRAARLTKATGFRTFAHRKSVILEVVLKGRATKAGVERTKRTEGKTTGGKGIKKDGSAFFDKRSVSSSSPGDKRPADRMDRMSPKDI